MTQELTLRQLRRIAHERGVKRYTRMDKAELMAALVEDERNRLVNRFAEAFKRQWPSVREQLDRN